MNLSDLKQLSEVQLLDVRLADDYEATHLEGAVNNCVFEVAFRDRLASTAPNSKATTVVYGANDTSGEAQKKSARVKQSQDRAVRRVCETIKTTNQFLEQEALFIHEG